MTEALPAITAVAVTLGVLGQVVLAVMAQRAAAKVEEVKQSLQFSDAKTAHSLEDIKHTGEATHTLVNANMGAQLKISAIALRRVAELTKHPDDIAAAELAERLLKEHDLKQRSVDARERE